MIEILPIKSLTDEDSVIFGTLSVALGKLSRSNLKVGSGIVVTAPHLKLQTILKHFEFNSKEVFEQSLTLVKKEIVKIPIPDLLQKETGKHSLFWLNDQTVSSVGRLWESLLFIWLDEVKSRVWREGFYKGVTENLDPQVVIFARNPKSFGLAFFDSIVDEVVINVKVGKLHPNDLKKLDEIVREANKKLFIPHEYKWILDPDIKLVGLKPYTPPSVIPANAGIHLTDKLLDPRRSLPRTIVRGGDDSKRSAAKVILDLSTGLVVEKDLDGVYIAAEKIFDLNKPRDSFENLVLKLMESANAFPSVPVLFKLADASEGMGKVRGALRLLHQQSLFKPMVEALDFVRHKKGLTNIHIVVPFVRTVNELMQIKRELAINKLMRKNSLKLWLEIAVPENIINLEDYIITGIDGVVLNIDELILYLNGFDSTQEELMFYKNEVGALLKFLEDGLRILHKVKLPFIAYGSLSLNPKVLEFLMEKGVYGVVVQRYEAPSIYDLLKIAEKRLVLSRAA